MPTFDHGSAVLAPVAIAVPILAACLVLVAGERLPRLVIDIASMTAVAAVIGILAYVLSTSTTGHVVAWMAGWTPHNGYSVGISLVVDPIGAGIALLASCLVLLSLLYSSRYIESVRGHFHALILLFLAGMVGLSLTGDIFDMFCFFELMGAAAYGLTGMHIEEEASLQGALNFGIINSLGAYVTLMGIGILFSRTGTLGLAELGRSLDHHRPDALVVAAMVLVSTGFLVKAAMVPFHFWLADAHAVAPAPVCVIFSGVMVPLGVYSAFRIYWIVFAGSIPAGDVRRTFVVLGAATAIVGAVMALSQRHVKRLLAYSTIAHMGLFIVALGWLTAGGVAGALLYAAGHAGVKGALFLMAGILLNLYSTMDEHELHGRAKDHRVLGMLFVLGGLALAALPPFGTGLGKAVSEEAGTSLGYGWAPALFVGVSAVTGGAVLRVAARVFFGMGPRPSTDGGSSTGAPRSTGSEAAADVRLSRVPWSMVVPVVVLLAGAARGRSDPRSELGGGSRGAFFVDRSGYISQTLFASPFHVAVNATSAWTPLGVGLDVLSAALGVGVAAAALYGRPLLERLPVLQRVRTPVDALHRVHSGHVGDYVAWMMVGIAVLAGFVGLPIR